MYVFYKGMSNNKKYMINRIIKQYSDYVRIFYFDLILVWKYGSQKGAIELYESLQEKKAVKTTKKMEKSKIFLAANDKLMKSKESFSFHDSKEL